MKAIITSIYKWVTTKFTGLTNSRTVNQEKFATIQHYRGRKAVQCVVPHGWNCSLRLRTRPRYERYNTYPTKQDS